jgi:two-component system, cell cycle sensor histidine kinase PleC
MAASTLSFFSGIAPESRAGGKARPRLPEVAVPAQRIDDELIRSFARHYVRTWPTVLLLACTLFVAATLWASVEALVPGLLLIIGTVIVTSVACRHFIEGTHGEPTLRTWRRGLLIGEFVQGFGWVLFAVPFFMDEQASPNLNAHSFVLVAVLIVMIATAILRARIFAAVLAGLLPLSLAILLAATQAKSTETGVLALLTLGAQFFLVYFAWRLHRSTAAVIRSRVAMQAKVEELERAKATSTAAQRRADAADRAKQLFLATMSHELRTPLNAILGFSEVMKNEVLGSHSTPSYREYASDIHGSGQHLLALINEILDLARIQAGHYALSEEVLRLDDVVAESLAAVASAVDAKSLRVATAFDETLPGVEADGRALRQIVGNLLSNAVKFTPRGGHIAIKVGWTSLGGQYVSVKDDGPGIPDDEIPLVLSSFGRGSLAVSTAAQGVGLGLPIVKGLAELHGGRFVLSSRPGGGTEATFIVPAARVVSTVNGEAAPQALGSQEAA